MSTAAVAMGAVACGAPGENSTHGSDGAGGNPTTSGSATSDSATSSSATGGGGEGGTTGSGGSSPGGDCPEETKLVYLLGQYGELYSFNPPTLEIKIIGAIQCPSGESAKPYSIAIDRKGIAWILFTDNKLYKYNLKDSSCVATAYVPYQNFTTFGMAFVSEWPGSTKEMLVVAQHGVKHRGYAQINTETLELSLVGNYGLSHDAALTGTGDGKLYGFFKEKTVVVAGMDKTSGQSEFIAPLPDVSFGSGWAFAFWGGDLWLFTSPEGQSRIDRNHPQETKTVTVNPGIGINIIGAGVSTCAPLTPPN